MIICFYKLNETKFTYYLNRKTFKHKILEGVKRIRKQEQEHKYK